MAHAWFLVIVIIMTSILTTGISSEITKEDLYETRRQNAENITKELMLTQLERTFLSQVRVIFLTTGVTTGLGQTDIGSSLGLLLQATGLEVSAISLAPIMNDDAGIWSEYERGDFFVAEDGSGHVSEMGDYERVLGIATEPNSSFTLGRIFDFAHKLEEAGKYFNDAGETRSVYLQDMEKVIADVMARALMSSPLAGTYELDSPAYKDFDDDELPMATVIVDISGVIGDENSHLLLSGISRLRQEMLGELDIDNFITESTPFQKEQIEQRFCHIHVTAITEVRQDSRDMIYPLVKSVKELENQALRPDLLVVRSAKPVPDITTTTGAQLAKRISDETHVAPEHIFFVNQFSDDYLMPRYLLENNVLHNVIKKLDLRFEGAKTTINTLIFPKKLKQFSAVHQRVTREREMTELKIGLIGKYSLEPKSYSTIKQAIRQSGIFLGFDVQIVFIEPSFLDERMNRSDGQGSESRRHVFSEHWNRLEDVKGAIVTGTTAGRGLEGMLAALKRLRIKEVPTLAIGLGMHYMVIEWARNVMNLTGALSEEMDPKIDEEKKVIEKIKFFDGKNMTDKRIGGFDVFLKPHCLISRLYNNSLSISQRFAQRFGINPKFRDDLRDSGLDVVGFNEKSEEKSSQSDVVESRKHKFYVGEQFHPEFVSKPLAPSPVIAGLVAAAGCKLESVLDCWKVWDPQTEQVLNFNNSIYRKLEPGNDVYRKLLKP